MKASKYYENRKIYGKDLSLASTDNSGEKVKASDYYNEYQAKKYRKELSEYDIDYINNTNLYGLSEDEKKKYKDTLSNYKNTLDNLKKYDSSFSEDEYTSSVDTIKALNDRFDTLSQFKSADEYNSAVYANKYANYDYDKAIEKLDELVNYSDGKEAATEAQWLQKNINQFKNEEQLKKEIDKANSDIDAATKELRLYDDYDFLDDAQIKRESELRGIIQKSREVIAQANQYYLAKKKSRETEETNKKIADKYADVKTIPGWDTFVENTAKERDNIRLTGFNGTNVGSTYADGSIFNDPALKDYIYDTYETDANGKRIKKIGGITNEEATMYAFLKEEDPQRAKEFLKDLKPVLNYRTQEVQDTNIRTLADKAPITASALSVAVAPLKAVGALSSIGQMVTDGKIDTNSKWFDASRFQSAVRDEVSQNIESGDSLKTLKHIGSFLYQTGMSIGDFMLTTYLTGGLGGGAISKVSEVANLTVMSGGAMADSIIEAKERGLSDGAALGTGIAAGIAEALFEKLSLENLSSLQAKGLPGFKNRIKDILKQSFTEGSEEFFTDIANAVTDTIINGENAALSQQMQRYMVESNLSYDEAKEQTIIDFGQQLFESFLGGAISGGAVGAVATGSAIRNDKAVGNALVKANQAENVLQAGKTFNADSDSGIRTKLAEQNAAKNDGKVSAEYLGNLYKSMAMESTSNMQGEARKVIADDIGERLEKAGTKATDNAENAILKSLFDQKLNRSERNALKNPEVKSVYEDILSDGNYFNELFGNDEKIGAYTEALKTVNDVNQIVDNVSFSEAINEKYTVDDTKGASISDINISDNGDIYIEQDGKQIPITEADIKSDTGVLAEELNTINDVDEKKAVLAAIKNGKNEGISDIGSTITYATTMYEYGLRNAGIELTNEENRGTLTESQAKELYLAGNEARAQVKAEDRRESERLVKKYGTGITPGKVTGTEKLKNKKLTARQNLVLNFARYLSATKGLNINIVYSTEEMQRANYKNGEFNRDTNTVEIDLNAGITATQMAEIALQTLSHEVTHIMRQRGGAEYDALSDFVFTELEKGDGISRDVRIDTEIDRLTRKNRLKGKTEAEKVDYAEDEIVARACSDRLTNSQTLANFIGEMLGFNTNLAKQFSKSVGESISLTQKYFDDLLKDYNSTSSEAKLIRETSKRLDEFQKLWEEAYDSAWASYNARNAELAENTSSGEGIFFESAEPKSNVSNDDRDSEYLELAKNPEKNEARLREMVDAAAIKYGFNEKLYHQTDNEFYIFDTRHEGAGTRDNETPFGIFMKKYNNDIGIKGKKQMPLFARIKNPLKAVNRTSLVYELERLSQKYKTIKEQLKNLDKEYQKKFDESQKTWRAAVEKWRAENSKSKRQDAYDDEGIKKALSEEENILNEWTEKATILDKQAKEIITETLRSNGYDGIILLNDKGSFGRSTDAYIALDSNQIKSAELVTYDDKGNIIPLSERFRTDRTGEDAWKNEDIRYDDERGVEKYTEKQYNNYGWINYNKVVSFDVEQRAFSNFADYKKNNYKFPITDNNEVVIPTGEKNKLDIFFLIDIRSSINSPKVNAILKKTSLFDIILETIGEDFYGKGNRLQSRIIEDYCKYEILERFTQYDYPSYSSNKRKDARNIKESYSNNQAKQDGNGSNQSNREIDGDSEGLTTDTNGEVRDSDREYETARDILRRLKAESQGTENGRDRVREYQDRLAELDRYQTMHDEAESLYSEAQTMGNIDDMRRYRNRMINSRARLNEIESQLTKLEANKTLQGIINKEKEYTRRYTAEQGRAKVQEVRDKSVRDKFVTRLQSKYKILSRMLRDNTVKQHIPEPLKKPLQTFLQAFDFSSKRRLSGGPDTINDAAFVASLSNLNAALDNVTDNKSWDEARTDGKLLIPQEIVAELKAITKNIMEYITIMQNEEYIINNMPVSDLKALDRVTGVILTSIRNANEFLSMKEAAKISFVSHKDMEYLYTIKPKEEMGKLTQAINEKVLWNSRQPYYAFQMFGEGGKTIYNSIMEGFGKLAQHSEELINYTKSVYTSAEAKAWANDVRTVELSNLKTIKMTVPQIMTFYATTKREQGLKHIKELGIRVSDFDAKHKTVTQNKPQTFLLDSDFKTIISKLDERQKEVADKLQEYMNTVGSDLANEISLMLYGTKMYNEVNYFPLFSEPTQVRKNDPIKNESSILGLVNKSFTKSTNPNAHNTIVIYDIFDVFSKHMNDVLKYNALALPIVDAVKWFGYREITEYEPGVVKSTGRTLQNALSSAYGKPAANYIRQFLLDVNTQTSSADVVYDMAKKIIANSKAAAVAANLRVALLQPTSYLRAAAVIDGDLLLKAAKKSPVQLKSRVEKMKKYSGNALWKSLGFFSSDVTTSLETKIKHTEGFKDKAVEVSMKGAEWGDTYTWAALWNACEMQTVRNGIENDGSDAFYKAVGKLFDEATIRTQVFDSVISRSQTMRNKGAYSQMKSAFMSEPQLSFNLLLDAVTQIDIDVRRGVSRKEAIKAHSQGIKRTFVAYTTTNLLAALVESLFDLWRDDEKDDSALDFLLYRYMPNFVQDMSILQKLPLIKDVEHYIVAAALKAIGSRQDKESFIRKLSNNVYTDTDDMFTATIADLVGNVSKMVSYGTDIMLDNKPFEWSEFLTQLKRLGKSVSTFTGLPIYNAWREIEDFYENVKWIFEQL